MMDRRVFLLTIIVIVCFFCIGCNNKKGNEKTATNVVTTKSIKKLTAACYSGEVAVKHTIKGIGKPIEICLVAHDIIKVTYDISKLDTKVNNNKDTITVFMPEYELVPVDHPAAYHYLVGNPSDELDRQLKQEALNTIKAIAYDPNTRLIEIAESSCQKQMRKLYEAKGYKSVVVVFKNDK